MNFDKPSIEFGRNGFKAYCKKKDLSLVMNALKGGY